jgi:hypothetical protein
MQGSHSTDVVGQGAEASSLMEQGSFASLDAEALGPNPCLRSLATWHLTGL